MIRCGKRVSGFHHFSTESVDTDFYSIINWTVKHFIIGNRSEHEKWEGEVHRSGTYPMMWSTYDVDTCNITQYTKLIEYATRPMIFVESEI